MAAAINIDTTVNPQLINSRFAYVAVSRASLDAEIYTNDGTDLGQRLSGDVSKSSALEFSHSTDNVIADIGLDLRQCPQCVAKRH